MYEKIFFLIKKKSFKNNRRKGKKIFLHFFFLLFKKSGFIFYFCIFFWVFLVFLLFLVCTKKIERKDENKKDGNVKYRIHFYFLSIFQRRGKKIFFFSIQNSASFLERANSSWNKALHKTNDMLINIEL